MPIILKIKWNIWDQNFVFNEPVPLFGNKLFHGYLFYLISQK